MAKFEEADPRWKVQDLGEKGRNVNNWHWTENDCFPWFKEQFTNAFEDVVILTGAVSGGNAELKITKVDKCSGEASLSRRKGKKVMLLYELELNLKWEVTIKNEAGEIVSSAKGSFNMPCIDTVEDIDGFEIQVKCNKDQAENQTANKYAKNEGTAKVKSIIVSVIEKLKAETSQAPPPTQNSDGDGDSSGQSSQVLTAALKAAAIDAGHTSKAHQNSKADGTVNISTDFNAPIREVFECLTVPQRLMAFTQSKAQVGTNAGDAFSLFDGSISGTVVECIKDQKLVWKWRQSSWADGVFSTCTVAFTENGAGSCRVTVTQTGIPQSDAHGNDDMVRVVEEGWKRNILDRIKMVFGYGVPEFH